MLLRTVALTLTSFALTTGIALAQAPAGQDEFVPLSSLPPGQELPAAPLVLASYASFLLLMMFYLWTIWRRINKVEQDLNDLKRRQGAASR